MAPTRWLCLFGHREYLDHNQPAPVDSPVQGLPPWTARICFLTERRGEKNGFMILFVVHTSVHSLSTPTHNPYGLWKMLTTHALSYCIHVHLDTHTFAYTYKNRCTHTHSAPAHTFHLLAQNLLNNWNWMRYKKRIGTIRETKPAFTHTCKLYECNNDLLASCQKTEYDIIDWGVWVLLVMIH